MVDQRDSEPAIHIETEEVRGGETTGRMRWVLLVSILLAVVILSLLVWGPYLFHQ